ncbi:MAG: mercuric transporter MerT family protein [Gammaproteobacteria bacterium]
MEDQKKIIATTGGAIGISGIASFIGLCCIGPWSVALLGVSGAITMARFAYLRPYILVAAAIMLGWAFWRVYIRRPECDDNGCETRPSYWLQSALWTAALLVLLAFFAEELQWILVDPTPVHLRNPD